MNLDEKINDEQMNNWTVLMSNFGRNANYTLKHDKKNAKDVSRRRTQRPALEQTLLVLETYLRSSSRIIAAHGDMSWRKLLRDEMQNQNEQKGWMRKIHE
jgi:hypothetical protein